METAFFRHLQGKNVVVMGLGLHGGGLATTKWLLRHGAKVLVTDLRNRRILAPSLRQLPRHSRLTFILGRHRHTDFHDADLIVANPGVPSGSPYLATAKTNGIPIVNEATIFFTLAPCLVIGVTGTRGKSTTSALLAHCLRSRFSKVVLTGNIGRNAMLAVLDSLTPSSRAVVELSSWQLEGLRSLRRSPHIAVVTNLFDDHLNRYPSRSAYFAAKDLLWRFQNQHDYCIMNRDIPALRARGRHVPSRRYWFSLRRFGEENGLFLYRNTLLFRRSGKETAIASVSDVFLPGRHNLQNVMAAAAAAILSGVSVRSLRPALRRFSGMPGRLEYVTTLQGVRYINDTTSTSPAGTEAALMSFPRKSVVLIAGGEDKKLPYASLARLIARRVKSVVFLPGTATKKILRYLPGSCSVAQAPTMRDAVRLASKMAREGDAVVLSPGAASFNLFLHEFDRGDHFVKAVRNLQP